jgi:hypothetical protein
MELVNRTPFPAGMFRTAVGDDRIAAAVVARVTYDLTASGLVPSAEQPWKFSPAPWEGPYGPMDGDEVFYRGGVDVFVFGHARAEGGRDARQIDVTIEVAEFRRRVVVFGDRVWERQGRTLAPSAPRPFRALPLTLAHAYGGKAEWDGLAVPFPYNADGKGYYLEEEQAVGRPLPNIEDPERLVRRWDERPDPVGVTPCPQVNGLRLREGLDCDDKCMPRGIRPSLFNAAFPRMIAPRVQPGDRGRLSGVQEAGPLVFTIPPTELQVRLQLADTVLERSLAVDQLGIEVDRGRVFLAYRYPFRYVVQPLQKRSCELARVPAPATNGGSRP